MQAISDLTWLKHLTTGRVLERFPFEQHQAVALRISATGGSSLDQYHLRILFFPPDSSRPVLSLNLESSILGEYLLTLQSGSEHRVFGRVTEPMSYPDFKRWALQVAREELPPPEPPG